jgi:hypothetical protein
VDRSSANSSRGLAVLGMEDRSRASSRRTVASALGCSWEATPWSAVARNSTRPRARCRVLAGSLPVWAWATATRPARFMAASMATSTTARVSLDMDMGMASS